MRFPATRLRYGCGLLAAVGLAACAGQVDQLRTDLAAQVLRHSLSASPQDPLTAFYREHPEPLWVRHGKLRPEAQAVLTLSGNDERLAASIQRAVGGSPAALANAELALSEALVRAALAARNSTVRVEFADRELAPPRNGLDVLRAAARAPSLAEHLEGLIHGNPLYAELVAARAALALSPAEDAKVEANLERLRALPSDLGERFVLVDVPAARLWLYERNKPVASMRIVAGAREDPTPLMAAQLRYAVLNPYWNIPPDLVSRRVAPRVLRAGPRTLLDQNMEVLQDWTPAAAEIRAETVDWATVAQGAVLRVRQRPGPANTLGRVKFAMPNALGVYLHDTPERGRLSALPAYRSAGCVRLAQSDKLGRWLFGASWSTERPPETRLTLRKPVPVYIVYRTARVENGAIRFLPDPYGLDTRPLHQTPAPPRPASKPGSVQTKPTAGQGWPMTHSWSIAT